MKLILQILDEERNNTAATTGGMESNCLWIGLFYYKVSYLN